jgi:hypothetical protein
VQGQLPVASARSALDSFLRGGTQMPSLLRPAPHLQRVESLNAAATAVRPVRRCLRKSKAVPRPSWGNSLVKYCKKSNRKSMLNKTNI